MIYLSFDQKFRVASPEGDCFNEKIEFEEKKFFRHFAKTVARQQSWPADEISKKKFVFEILRDVDGYIAFFDNF